MRLQSNFLEIPTIGETIDMVDEMGVFHSVKTIEIDKIGNKEVRICDIDGVLYRLIHSQSPQGSCWVGNNTHLSIVSDF